ncbi:MAG TPA: hypothetical protein VMW09_06835 [Desulfatiglandales bacterium]|nr:hypothetical protein [Desulfatiglandales bacterium]
MENQAKQTNKEKNFEQLSLVNTIQKKTIELQEKLIKKMKSHLGRMMNIMEKSKDEINQLKTITKEMKKRIEVLEEKEAQKEKLRVIE